MNSDFTVLAPSDYMSGRLESDGVRVDRTLRNFVPDSARLGECNSDEYEKPVLLYVGMLEPHKGVSTLLQAFESSSRTPSASPPRL